MDASSACSISTAHSWRGSTRRMPPGWKHSCRFCSRPPKPMSAKTPIIVAVSGLSSNTGKTTLVCELLERLPGWEAIKLTRGHYRSCGKDPGGCCVSDLLRDEPLIRSGREANYEKGKDTGRFWDAGAANVHLVIVGEEQVEAGINGPLSRGRSAGGVVQSN